MPIVAYCWRCEADIPMLTEPEWEQMDPALARALEDVKDYRAQHGVSLKEARDTARGQEARILYFRLTGYLEPNVDAIWHHRRSLYGPPCLHCAKPLRTPKASFCAACGERA